MRYFETSNASRRYNAGGSRINFELVSSQGGSWRGVLAVGEPIASALAAAGYPTITEITQEEYEEAQKKTPETSTQSTGLQPPPTHNRPPLAVAVVGNGNTSVLVEPMKESPAPSPVDGPVVNELKTTKLDFEDELTPSVKKLDRS